MPARLQLEVSERQISRRRVGGADRELGEEQRRDGASDAPSATSRAAFSEWVRGSAWATCAIQFGRSASATFTPQKTSRRQSSMFVEDDAAADPEPDRCVQRPKPVHEIAVTSVSSASDG